MSEAALDPQVSELLTAAVIRKRCSKILAKAEGGGTAFELKRDRLAPTAARVLEVTRSQYPDLKVPFHSRRRHFQAGGVDRMKDLARVLEPKLQSLSADQARIERACTELDLVFASVLLDAGAGPSWTYRDADRSQTGRSEGLGIASLRMFIAGELAPERLERFDLATLEKGFQLSATNPLVGAEGRVAVLRGLGRAVREAGASRPSDFFRSWIESRAELPASELLRTVLLKFKSIWPGRASLHGTPLGDTWSYPGFGAPEGSFESFVPFHKLSQWLTYSLMEPMQDAGVRFVRLDEMTGLPEYRNGGLMIDSGLLTLRDPSLLGRAHDPASPLVIEWRALTVMLLDEIAAEIRRTLGRTAEQMPLVQILEGGTWSTGRVLARERRPDGSPPINIVSDGTVF